MTARIARHRLEPRHRIDPISRWRSRRVGAIAAVVGAISLAVGGAGFASALVGDGYQRGPAIVSDNLNRVVHSGWGTAQLGGAWKYSRAALFAADGRVGSTLPQAAGSSTLASLPSVSAADVDAVVTISLADLPKRGNGIYSGIWVRSTGTSHYLAQFRWAPTGTGYVSILRVTPAGQTVLAAETVAVTKLRAGTPVQLEVQASDAAPVALRVRAWTGTTAPGWQRIASDSSSARITSPGSVGVWAYASRSTPTQPVRVDAVSAWRLQRVTAPTAPPTTPTVPPTTPTPTPPATGTPSAPPTAPVEPTPPTQPTDPQPTPPTTGVRGDPGSAAVGSTTYAIPAGALRVATSGSDSAAGTAENPFRTIQHAIDVAPSGGAVVVGAGTYHESLQIPRGKRLTIQSAPHSAVWLDGSREVSGFSSAGTAWSTPWTVSFDASPTYTRGAPDGTAAAWSFVNAAYPMAAHPDQVWIDGAAQRQVASAGQVAPGTFAVDGGRLLLGSNPAGHTVRASDTVKALVVHGDQSVVRGIGIRRYAPSVPDMGAVMVDAKGAVLENLEITDNATTGLSMDAAGIRASHITSSRNGMLGVHANYADGLRVDALLSTDNNTEHFNRAPVAGGLKVTRSRDVAVIDSALLRNDGHALWFDESVYKGVVSGTDILDNAGNGLDIELSSAFTVVDNVIARNGSAGVYVNDSDHVDIWNNTLDSNSRNVNVVDGDRVSTNLSTPGHDPRQSLPDPTVSWVAGYVTVGNNVLSNSKGNAILAVEDYTHRRSAAQMHVEANGNVYQRNTAGAPSWAVIWSTGAGNPAVYSTLDAFRSATGQDATSELLDGAAAVTGLAASSRVIALVPSVAVPVPSRIAAIVSFPATRQVGAFSR